MKVKRINGRNRMLSTIFFNKIRFTEGCHENRGAVVAQFFYWAPSAAPISLHFQFWEWDLRIALSGQTDPPLKTSEVAPATTAAPPCSRRPLHSFARWRRLRAKISLRKFAEKWGVTPVLRPRSSLGPGPKGRNGSVVTTTSTGSQQKLSNLSESR